MRTFSAAFHTIPFSFYDLFIFYIIPPYFCLFSSLFATLFLSFQLLSLQKCLCFALALSLSCFFLSHLFKPSYIFGYECEMRIVLTNCALLMRFMQSSYLSSFWCYSYWKCSLPPSACSFLCPFLEAYL